MRFQLVLALLLLGALAANADVYDEQEALAGVLSTTLSDYFGQNVTLEEANWDPTKPRWIDEFQLETGGMGELYKFNVRKLGDYMDPLSMSRTANGIDLSFEEAEPGSPMKRYEFEFHCLKGGYDLQVWAYTDWVNYTNALALFDVTTQACLDYQELPLVEGEPTPSPEPSEEPTVEPTEGPQEPDCDGHDMGEVWPAGDDCNDCVCTPEGIECTELACEPTPSPEPTAEPTAEPTMEPSEEPTQAPAEPEEDGDDPLAWAAFLVIIAGGAAIAYYGYKG